MRKLIILTLNWNAKDKLQKLYDSFLPALKDIQWHWFIKDNGSNDGSIDLINTWENPNITGVKYPHNRDNYSQGNNLLFKQANPNDEDLILLLNNDIVFADTASIHNMIKIMDNDPDVGIVGAKLNYVDRPKILQHAGVLFHPANIGTPFNYRAGFTEEEIDRKNRLFPIVTGAVLLTRANIYKQIGGLPEQMQWCFDDCYYCLEVGTLNKKIVYCGETNILHDESFSLKKNPVQKLFFNQNVKLFFGKWKDAIDKTLAEKYQNIEYGLYSK